MPTLRSATAAATAALLLGPSLVLAAINIDGTKAVNPVSADDPSPIGDPSAYNVNQHKCPLPCVDYANMHSWIPYFSLSRLRRCEEPMLLKFSANRPLDDPATDILIRACTLADQSSGNLEASTGKLSPNPDAEPMENPKKAGQLFDSSLNSAPACVVDGVQVQDAVEVFTSSEGGTGESSDAAGLMNGMLSFFQATDNCDEAVLFAYHKQTVASVYVGPGLGKPTVKSALAAMSSTLVDGGFIADRTIAQLCGGPERPSSRTMGIAIDTEGDLTAVQKMAAEWSEGTCVQQPELQFRGDLGAVTVFDIAGAPAVDVAGNGILNGNSTLASSRRLKRQSRKIPTGRNSKRDTCQYTEVVSGDGCPSLVARCGISAADFTLFNPSPTLCADLQPGDFVCCSAGDPYTLPTPDPPLPNADGTCATHLIVDQDTCASIATQFGVTVAEIEAWNAGKTWAWTECATMLLGYNMCVSDGAAGLPPPQEGSQCGPLVPGTTLPSDGSISLADINPCPLKACCSNWGFCGVFPAHCDIHQPEGGGPGSKEPGFATTCVSNCGNDIKINSDPPAAFERVGYYESYNLDRECLWLNAKDANTDGSYTHMHWAFGGIDPVTFMPTIEDNHNQWEDFKALPNMKRIVSFGGWAYSTDAATFNILRSAIITNAETFATNLAQWAEDEGLDGIDIDWEYPGMSDIYVGGEPIGKPTDGQHYLEFLTILKQKLGPGRSVSIAAPASFWYLQGFPIDQLGAVIDYIVYMTYDLHGQWDYGNANAFDQCDSGACIRSHVNLTETRNALSIITKAGVDNNKIFVGEASYGRSFHMAEEGCWEPMCDFTGTRILSDATPGRCTKTGGYLAMAELNEIKRSGEGIEAFHDGASNSDILLYNGDYVSYMTPTTKDTRRADWESLNFAGSIDWAVDLQFFGEADTAVTPERPESGEGCTGGEDITINSGDLCEFTCALGFCPESLCRCTHTGPLIDSPAEKDETNIIAYDQLDVSLNQLCRFACKYDYCPPNMCTTIPKDDEVVDYDQSPPGYDYADARRQNAMRCLVYQDREMRDASSQQCYAPCKAIVESAQEEGRTTNYGCIGFYPGQTETPWEKYPGTSYYVAPGMCSCDNWLVNEIADIIIEALPAIGQIACYILMSSFKLVLDIGLSAIPGIGKALDAGMDMLSVAAQTAAYLYPEEEDPEGAFSWWLSPCGGTDLVPDELKQAFGILSTVAGGVSSYKQPKNLPKGSGKKGDPANPVDRSAPKPLGPTPGGGITKKKACKISKAQETKRLGEAKHTYRVQSCVGDKTVRNEMVITSLVYAANAQPTQVGGSCKPAWPQACYHYSSAISVNPQWSTLTCPPVAASTKHRQNGKMTSTWSSEHTGAGWTAVANRAWPSVCDMDEYPPAYLLSDQDPAFVNGGISSNGQLMRYLPDKQNRPAGRIWKGSCFMGPVKQMSDNVFKNKVLDDNNRQVIPVNDNSIRLLQTLASATVDTHPEFTMTAWGQSGNPPVNDGLADNPCWPSGIAPLDPGFALLAVDPYYNNAAPPYNYQQPYAPGTNGA